MTVPAENSPSSSVISLDGGMPLPRSAYSDKIETFCGYLNFPAPANDPAYILFEPLIEPLIAHSTRGQPDIRSIKDLGVSLTERIKKFWTKLRGSSSNDVFEYLTIETKSRQAASRFCEKLRAIDEAHISVPFISEENGPRVTLRSEDFADLDTALEDGLAYSLVVEGGDETKEDEAEGLIKISLGLRKNMNGNEVKVIIVEDLEMQDQLSIFQSMRG